MTEVAVHLVPVFEKDLPAVYSLLAELNPPSLASDEHEAISVPSNGSWSREDLIELHDRCKTVHRAIVTRIAAAGIEGAPATYEELREAGAAVAHVSDFDYDNLRGNLAWISKYSKGVKGTKVWPFKFSDLGPAAVKGDRYQYLMPAELATWWLEISGD